MGKKKRPIESDADGYLRTGIYQRPVVPEDISPAEAEQRLEEWIEKLENPRSIHSWLNEWLECCAEIIRPHLDDNGHTTYALNLGDGWLPYRIADEIPDSVEAEQLRDAIACMNEVRSMSGHIADDDTLEGDLGWVINAAFRLGRMTEQMQIRPFEPRALTGKRVLEGSSKGAETANQGRAEIYAAEAETFQDEVDALIADKLSYQQATEKVAQSHCVSGRHVRDNTINHSPRNRGRKR